MGWPGGSGEGTTLPWHTGIAGAEAWQATHTLFLFGPGSKLTNVLEWSGGGLGPGGHRSPSSLHLCLCGACFTHCPSLAAPSLLAPVSDVQLTACRCYCGVHPRGMVVGEGEVFSAVGLGGCGSGAFLFPSPFLSSQVLQGSARATEHAQAL